jgi:hypothetical protein
VYDVCFTRADILGTGEARFTGADTLGMGIEYPDGAQFPVVTAVELAPIAAGIRASHTICAVNGNDVQPMAFGVIVSHLRARPVVRVTFARCMTRRAAALEEAAAEARRTEALEEASAEAGGSDGGGGGVGGVGGGGRGGVGDDQRTHDEQALINVVNEGCTKGGGLKVLSDTHGGTGKYWEGLWKKLVEGKRGRYRVKASEEGKVEENQAKRQKTD